MPRFAANLSMLYQDLALFDRFEAAARDGFKAVEYLFPYESDPREIVSRLKHNGLQQVLLNAPPGDWHAGERGMACLPGRENDFRSSFRKALEYAAALSCPRIHVMAGIAPGDCSRDALYATYVSRLRWAAQEAAREGVEVLIEPINTRDIPRYFLNRQGEAHNALEDTGAPNLKVQMDLYHCQVVEGDVATKLRHYLPTGNIGHIQIAGVPERQEPDVGELNYAYLFALLDECQYGGWVGCEYRPRAGATPGGTSQGLGWLKPYV